MPTNLPENEPARLAALRRYKILDTLPEQSYDDIAFLASQICQTPIALITLVDKDRQWYKAKIGLEAEETSRDISFCSHAILEPDKIFTVNDATRDARFADNSSVTGDPHIRFYAGASLIVASGEALGTLCVVDRQPRVLTHEQQNALFILARQVMTQLETRRQLLEREAELARQQQLETILRDSEQRIYSFLSHTPTVAFMKDEDGRMVFINKKMEQVFNLRNDHLVGKFDSEWLPPETAQQVRENDCRVLETNQPIEVVETVAASSGDPTHWLSLKFPFTDSLGKRFVGGVALDITERIKIEQRLQESEEHSRHLFENSQGFICTHDLQGVILSINTAAAAGLLYRPEELIGKNLREVLAPNVQHLFPDYLMRIRQHKMDDGFFMILTETGEERTWKYRNVLYKPSSGAAYVIGHAQDVTELQQIQKSLQNLSITDELTGLYNLRGFQTLAEQASKVARRNGEDCLLLYADLDNLKQTNDLFGHEAGSQMIVETAHLLKSVFRDSDIIARIGGDEFTVLMTTGTTLNNCEIKERLQKKIAEVNCEKRFAFKLSLSVGIISFKPNETTLDQAICQADGEMYKEKKCRKTKREISLQNSASSRGRAKVNTQTRKTSQSRLQ